MPIFDVQIFSASHPQGPSQDYQIEAANAEVARAAAKDRFVHDFPDVAGAYGFNRHVDLVALSKPRTASPEPSE